MLTDPKFVVPEPVNPACQFQIPLKLEGWMFTQGMVRGKKHAEAESLLHTYLHCGRNSEAWAP
jgi:hypothetical protein